MKKMQNISIFFFFLLLFFIRGILEEKITSFLKTPELDQTLMIQNQNLKEELQKMEENFHIDLEEPQIIYTKVIYQDPFSFFDSISILKGEEEGLKENLVVLQKNTLVGVIDSVKSHSSIVRLVTNPDFNISVKIRDTYGVMTTNKKRECWIENLTKDVLLEVGDEIKTSGLTEIPANILVGTVAEIEKDELGLIQKVKVKLASDFNDLSYLTILKGAENS